MAELLAAAATLLAVAALATSVPSLLREPRGGDARARLMPSLVILTGGAAITFAAWLAFEARCGHHCDPAMAASGPAGIHRWWRRHDAWQWSAELTIAAAALAFAALAFAMAARGAARSGAPLWTARLAYAVWILLFLAAPAAYELVKS